MGRVESGDRLPVILLQGKGVIRKKTLKEKD
jgi:hypothetical protein